MVSYSALIMCRLLRWCVSSPAHCGWDGIFIAVGTELDFSQASAICLPSGHWRPFIADTVRRHIPCTAERRCCWAHVCALAQASQSPGEAPGVRQSVSMPLRNEVGKIVPVVCPQMSPGCSTPVLGAFPFMCGEIVGGVLRCSAIAFCSLVCPLRHSNPTYRASATDHSESVGKLS